MTESLQRPWWKEPMVWLVAGLPAVAVVASFTTYYIAADKPDTLVNAGYHKEGMAPGKDTTLEERAATLAITGDLAIMNGKVRLTFTSRLAVQPARLELLLLHPTQVDKDLRLELEGIGQGLYLATIPDDATGKRQWILEPNDRSWRLAGELTLPLPSAIKINSDSFHNHP